DQRVIPFFEKDAWAEWKPRGARADGVQAAFQRHREVIGVRRAADQAAEHADHLQDFGDAALVEGHHRVAAADQLADDVRLQIGEGEDEVRAQRRDLVEVRVDEGGHARLLPRFRRPHGVAGDADDAMTLAEQVERFGRFLGQADDALGEQHAMIISYDDHFIRSSFDRTIISYDYSVASSICRTRSASTSSANGFCRNAERAIWL